MTRVAVAIRPAPSLAAVPRRRALRGRPGTDFTTRGARSERLAPLRAGAGPSEKGFALSSVDTARQLRFDPPGPGSWDTDVVHFPRPVTRYWSGMHPEPFKRGFLEFTRNYGMLIDGLEYAYINGFCYKTVVPAPESEIPERFQRAEEVFQRKIWRDQLQEIGLELVEVRRLPGD